jgi:hypothetical protein
MYTLSAYETKVACGRLGFNRRKKLESMSSVAMVCYVIIAIAIAPVVFDLSWYLDYYPEPRATLVLQLQ